MLTHLVGKDRKTFFSALAVLACAIVVCEVLLIVFDDVKVGPTFVLKGILWVIVGVASIRELRALRDGPDA